MSGQELTEMEKLKENISEFKAEVSRQLLTITTTLNRMNEALLGNEYGSDNSYKARLERLETFAEEQRSLMFKQRIYMAVAGGAGTAIMFIIEHWNAVLKLFSKP
jgi:pilus assembly protein TadC